MCPCCDTRPPRVEPCCAAGHLPGIVPACFRARMWAMMSARWSAVNLNIGIPACGVVSAMVKAV